VNAQAEGVRAFLNPAVPPAAEPSGLARLRAHAREEFARRGFPTTRDEDWKYTNVAPIASTRFVAAPEGGRPSEAPLAPLGGGRLIFLNDRLAVREPPAGGWAPNFVADGASAHWPRCESLLGSVARFDADAFTALNTALFREAALLWAPDGTVVEDPVVVVFECRPGTEPTALHPRALFVAGAGAQLAVVEIHTGICGAPYFRNAVTEILAGAGARVRHTKILLEGSAATHIGTTFVRLERDAAFEGRLFTLGGRLVRADTDLALHGEGAQATLDGLYLVSGDQHVDHHTTLRHIHPRGTSRQVYKGVLTGRGRAVFNGKVVIHPGAAKSDAHQINRNLVLSEDAEVDTKPQLEVFADDVKCSHGANVGRLDEDAVFYLRARGLDRRTATHVLTRAFAGEIVERVPEAPVRALLEEVLDRWMGAS
jgi:Fe-S cluster assembly protein SufD